MSLNISFDIGGVLTKYPRTFRRLIEALQEGGAEVYVITDMTDKETAIAMLCDNGFGIPASNILHAQYAAHGEMCKAKIIKDYGIDIHIDDFPGYLANTSCVNLFVWPNPNEPYYADSFVTDGSEGDFGRRRPAKI